MAPTSDSRFDALFEAYRSNVWLYCSRRLGTAHADDAMGDVFLTVWRRLDEAPETADALPWLYRISHLTVLNHRRSVRRRNRLREKVAGVRVGPATPVADQVVIRDEVRAVVGLLDKLSTTDAEILKMAAWEHLDTAQIAAVLDISPDAAKQRLSRARKRLVGIYNRKYRKADVAPPLLGKEVRDEH